MPPSDFLVKSNPKTAIGAYYRMGAITVQNNVHLERLLTTDPTMEQYMRTAVSYVLQQARKDVVSDIAGELESDPRHAATAVRRVLYRQVLGGNLNILRKKRAGSRGNVPSSTRGRLERTEQLMGYQGSDRGFILRFVNAGTKERVATHMNGNRIKRSEKIKSRTYISGKIGGRGQLLGKNFFGKYSREAIEEAVPLLIKEFERIIAEQAKQ